MSTPTPRTDDAAQDDADTLYKESCALETKLNLALARVAELETDRNRFEIESDKWAQEALDCGKKLDSLTRQLSEAQAQLEKQRLILVANQKIMDGAGDSIRDLLAQLTSAREDSARLDRLERHFGIIGQHTSLKYFYRVFGPRDSSNQFKSLRALVDAVSGHLTGRTETPAGGETELAASPETEGLEPFTPVTPPQFGTLTTSWGEECTVKVYGSLDDGKVALFNYTTDGRLVTGAMAPMESIEFDSPLPPPPQGKEQE